MTREEILSSAKKCVCGDREQDYGSPERNFGTIGDYWTIYFKAQSVPVNFSAHDVAIMMALVKVARITTGAKAKDDNYIDLAGYAACAGEVAADEA